MTGNSTQTVHRYVHTLERNLYEHREAAITISKFVIYVYKHSTWSYVKFRAVQQTFLRDFVNLLLTCNVKAMKKVFWNTVEDSDFQDI